MEATAADAVRTQRTIEIIKNVVLTHARWLPFEGLDFDVDAWASSIAKNAVQVINLGASARALAAQRRCRATAGSAARARKPLTTRGVHELPLRYRGGGLADDHLRRLRSQPRRPDWERGPPAWRRR